MNNANLKYSTNSDEHITVSLMRSMNQPSMTDTTSWDKFGNPTNKQERRIPGIYIMSNNGVIEPIPEIRWEKIKVI